MESVRASLTSAGVDSIDISRDGQHTILGHSFRSGAATTAASRGINGDATIKMLGRWKSEAYQLYIKKPKDQLTTVTRCLLQEDSQSKGKETRRNKSFACWIQLLARNDRKKLEREKNSLGGAREVFRQFGGVN